MDLVSNQSINNQLNNGLINQQLNNELNNCSEIHQYQNVTTSATTEFQSSSNHYKVPPTNSIVQLKRNQFSQQTSSKSFPIQSNEAKNVNNSSLRKGFQANLALNKINKVNSHPLAIKDESNSATLNRAKTIEQQPKSSFKNFTQILSYTKYNVGN